MEKKIIGGEFAIEEKLFEHSVKKGCFDNVRYSSGRCALYTILKDIEYLYGKQKILLPNYLCDSITKTVDDAGWKHGFYNINDELQAEIDEFSTYLNGEYNVILLINYFGMVKIDNIVNEIKRLNANIIIIVDNVQAYYEMDVPGIDYSFDSYRKWFPCPDGAMAKKYSDGVLVDLAFTNNEFAQYKLAGNLLKKHVDFIDEKIVLELIERGEEILEKDYLCECSEISRRIMDTLDIDYISKKRKRNSEILHKELEKAGIRHIYNKESTPLFIPVFLNNRDYVRRHFFQNNIFVPKHWPHVNDWLNGRNDLYDTELSLICDQRYDDDDMMKQIEILIHYAKTI